MAGALVASLARMQSEEGRETIRAALRSSNDSARRAAASALITMQDAASAAALEQCALSDADAEVRRICAASLVR
jgi:HEAT repeat protein